MQARAAAAVLALLSFFAVSFGESTKAWGAERVCQEKRIPAARAESKILVADTVDEPEAETVNAAYGYKNSPVAMEASYGYDNMAKGGRYLPVYVTLTNQQPEPFDGSVMMKSLESDFNIYEYEYPVNLEGEATIQINFNIPLGLRADQLYVKVFDSDGNQILQKRLKMNIRQDTPELLIGTLSDSQDKLEYLNDVGILHSTLRTRTCTMVAGSIPRQAIGLDQLDVLLITNYDIRRLSTWQTDTIKEWVSRGGILILGTGAGGQEAVETFLEFELEQELLEPEERVINMGDEFAIFGPSDVRLLLMSAYVNLKEGNGVLFSDGVPVVSAVRKEKGMIAVAAYDFCDISSFCEEHGYVDKLFTKLLGEERIRELAEYLYDGGSSIYWAVQGMLNSGSVEKLPRISLYAITIFCYILLAGPGLYFFLKQRELRMHYGALTVLLSLCCSGMIYLMGSNTRFEDTFFNYATVQDYSGDTVVSSVYMNMRTPYNKPYSVEVDGSYDIRPLVRSRGADDARPAQFTGEEKANINIFHGLEQTLLSVQDVEVFAPNYFRLEKREENSADLGITGSVTFFDGAVTGSITNHLGTDLEQGAVLCANAIVPIESLKAGETLVLDELPVFYYPLSRSFAVADFVAGNYQFEKLDTNSREYMDSLKRSNLLEFYLDQFLSGYQHGARVVAFPAGEERNPFLLQEQFEIDGLTLYTAAVDADYRKGELIYRTFAEISANVVSGIYSTGKNTMNGLSPLTLEYSLGGDITIEKLTFLSASEEFTENSGHGGTSAFAGDLYFYNYETENFDKMDSSQREFIHWQLEPYLSEENLITVKYAYDTPGDYTLDLSLPVIAAVGRKK
jgi:hypothetical protein